MDFDTINDKIVAEIKENYLKVLYKTVKKFEIILAGYNCSQQKRLRVFGEYGYELIFGAIEGEWLSCFVITRPTPKMNISFYLRKRLNSDILEYNPEPYFSDAFVNILVDKTDEKFELIKQLEKIVSFKSSIPFGDETIRYTVYDKNKENGYVLHWSYPFH